MPDTVHHVMWYTVYDAKLAICLHPAHLICAPGVLAIKAQTVLHPRFIIAARKRENRTSIPFFKKS